MKLYMEYFNSSPVEVKEAAPAEQVVHDWWLNKRLVSVTYLLHILHKNNECINETYTSSRLEVNWK